MNRFFACLYLAVLVSACAECEVIPGVKTAFYGVTQGGDTVTQYILTNASGLQRVKTMPSVSEQLTGIAFHITRSNPFTRLCVLCG